MNAKDFSEAEILQHLKDGGAVVCSIRLASGGDFTITISDENDYEILKDDIIPNMEMVFYLPGKETK